MANGVEVRVFGKGFPDAEVQVVLAADVVEVTHVP
jgi:hypothetical protein